MKKLLLAFLLLPTLAGAQELTKADVQTLSPQISNLISTIGTTMTSVNSQIAVQNVSLAQDARALGDLSIQLGSYPAPNQAQVDSMALVVASISNQVANIATWRQNASTAISSISQILGNISSMIASAV